MAHSTGSASQGLVPPPPGQVSDFASPPTQQPSQIALHTVMLFFVSLCFGIRLYTRQFITGSLGIEDYMCILAFCILIAYSALLLACGQYYLGHHIWDITVPNFIYGAELEFIAECLYLPVSACIKLSCLLFYRRIFSPNAIMVRVLYAGMIFIGLFYTVFLVLNIVDCLPIEHHWNPLVSGQCLPSGTTAYGSGALNVLTDIFIVCVPLPVLWRLNMKWPKKMRIIAVFGLGVVVVALSITRLALTPSIFHILDNTWALGSFAIYSILELDIGMICACLLAFPAFIDRHGAGLKTWLRSYSNLRRSTRSDDRSTAGFLQMSNGIAKSTPYSSREHANIPVPANAMIMHEIPPNRAILPNNASYRARLERMDMV